MEVDPVRTIEWMGNSVRLIDQRFLPRKEKYITCPDHLSVARAIKGMAIRGAPAIGVAAAFGVALAALKGRKRSKDLFLQDVEEACQILSRTRPTAVNLFWALDRMKRIMQQNRDQSVESIILSLVDEARRIYEEDIEINRRIGEKGAELIQSGSNLLTHCNTGALATAGYYGTALGVIRTAFLQGKQIHVYVDETRPFLQGARLTAWELMRQKIPMTLITDNMAGYFMSRRKIDAVLVGADRIACNGDTANKIGTYSLSVLARENGVPFYVIAPTSTIDPKIDSGEEIVIEERDHHEVVMINDRRIAPEGVQVANPAFDITPEGNISAIVSEVGVLYPPFKEKIAELNLLYEGIAHAPRRTTSHENWVIFKGEK
nr:S-methyl-5-thioribose-1-phosphate isomerase [Candidatus Hakubella thermalkaliphila]